MGSLLFLVCLPCVCVIGAAVAAYMGYQAMMENNAKPAPADQAAKPVEMVETAAHAVGGAANAMVHGVGSLFGSGKNANSDKK